VVESPARKETKLAIMECFANAQLFELYRSTEQGWVTLLRPEEQLTKAVSGIALAPGLLGCLCLSSTCDFRLDRLMARRLAAILAADVVSYSRMMAADEQGTHARLKALRQDFMT
jgi:hypothetical protein